MKIKKICCFYFPTLSSKFYFFILFLFGSLCRKCIPGLISDYCFRSNKKKDYNEEKTEKYFDILCNVASDLLTGIFHFKLKNKLKKIDESQERNYNYYISYIYNDETKKQKLFYKLIIIISIIDFICQLIFYVGCFANKENIVDKDKKNHNIDYLYSFLVIDIVSRYIFSIIVLKTNFYFHHRLSFYLNIIVLGVLVVIELIINKMENYEVLFLIISFIQYVLYSYEDILNKDALIKLFIFPETILFWKGIFTFFYFIFFTVFIFIFDDVFVFQNMHFDIDQIFHQIFLRIVFIMFNILRSIYLINVIDFFSSQHMSILKVLETILLSTYYFFDKKYKKEHNIYNNYFDFDDDNIDLIEMIACLLLLLFSLIYNEVIIINCKKMIEKTNFFLLLEANQENSEFLQIIRDMD